MNEDESLADRLSHFTPAHGVLDRDALIFAAGRASAKKHGGWMAIAGTLAASQLLTLVVLWPRAAAIPTAATQIVVASRTDITEKPESMASTEPPPFQLSRLRQEFLAVGCAPAGDQFSGPITPDKPPLRAGSLFPPSLEN